MDYVYGILSHADGENPLDYPALRDNPMELWVVAADAVTGGAGNAYFDGALGDPVPVQKAFDLECDRVVLIYNEGVVLAQKYASQGRVLIIAPDDTCGVDMLKRDKEALKRLYKKGIHDAQRIARFMKN